MQRGETLRAKRARLLSLNQIREIVMDSDSDESQNNASSTEDEEMEPRPPSQKCRFWHGMSSSDVSASTSEDEDVVENVAILQSFRTFGHRRSHSEIQGKGHFQTIHS